MGASIFSLRRGRQSLSMGWEERQMPSVCGGNTVACHLTRALSLLGVCLSTAARR